MTEYTGRIGVGNTRTMQVGDGADGDLMLSVYDPGTLKPSIEMHLFESEVIRLAHILNTWLEVRHILRRHVR